MRLTNAVLIASLAGGLAACSSSPTAGDFEAVEPARIHEVEVEVSASVPATAAVVVQGEIGGGCTTLLPPEQVRRGNEVTITLLTRTFIPAGVACTMDLKGFRERYPLLGTFPPGSYTVRVNDVVRTFTVGAVPLRDGS